MSSWLKYALIIIITAGIVGGGTYYFVHKKAVKDKNNLQSQIDNLNKKYDDAQKELTAAQTAATADWKTYINTQYSYTIKYPSDWFMYTASSEQAFEKRGGSSLLMGGDTYWSDHNSFGCNPSTCPTDLQSIDVIVYQDSSAGTIADFIRDQGGTFPFAPTISDFQTNSGTTGKRYLFAAHNDNSAIVNSENIYFEKGDEFFVFGFSNQNSLDAMEQVTFENMISSLQFN